MTIEMTSDRHTRTDSDRIVHTIGIVEILPDEMQVIVGGRRAGFTVREFEAFYILAEHTDHVVRRSDLHLRIFGHAMPHRGRAVDVLVRKVRHKLRLAAPDWIFIHTHFGVGYRFAPEPLPGTPAALDLPPGDRTR